MKHLPLAGVGGGGVLPVNKCTSAFTLSFSSTIRYSVTCTIIPIPITAFFSPILCLVQHQPVLVYLIPRSFFLFFTLSSTTNNGRIVPPLRNTDAWARNREDVKKLVNVHSTPSVQQLRHTLTSFPLCSWVLRLIFFFL